MAIFSEDLQKKDLASTGVYLNTEKVLNGVWRLTKVDIVKSNNPQYGAQPIDALFLRGVLKEGETIRYDFIDKNGEAKVFNSKSIAFYIGIKQAELVETDVFTIRREGTAAKTRYYVTKTPVKGAALEVPDEKPKETASEETGTINDQEPPIEQMEE